MKNLFAYILAGLFGLFVAAPRVDEDLARSDAAGLVAYAALAQSPPAPQPVEVKEQHETKATETIQPAAAEAQTTASAPAVAPAPLSPVYVAPVRANTAAPVGRPTFAPARIPTPFRYRSRW